MGPILRASLVFLAIGSGCEDIVVGGLLLIAKALLQMVVENLLILDDVANIVIWEMSRSSGGLPVIVLEYRAPSLSVDRPIVEEFVARASNAGVMIWCIEGIVIVHEE